MAENFLVHLKLHQESQGVFRYTLETAPDSLSNKYFPGVTVRPEKLTILMSPDEEGRWRVGGVRVAGQQIENGELKRLTVVPFTDPLDGDDPDRLPEWLKTIAEQHVLLMNDGSPELRERQQQAARKAASEILAGLMPGIGLTDEVADKILTAIRRVG